MSSKEDEIKNASVEDRFKMAIKNPELAGLVYKANEADRKKSIAEKVHRTQRPVLPSPTPVIPGDTRGLQPAGLHTPTMAEIVANANKPDPTRPHFNPVTDIPTLVNPLAPHPDFSGEVPRIVNPLKPGPKISGLG